MGSALLRMPQLLAALPLVLLASSVAGEVTLSADPVGADNTAGVYYASDEPVGG